jgi:methanogenic corrinoid protein MtbC1
MDTGLEGNNSDEGLRRSALVKALRRTYADALLTGEEVPAELAIRDAISARLTQAEIDEEVIAPALRKVGDLWEAGEISVADEHLATEITLRVLALQREAFRVRERRAARRVMLAAVQGEHHVMGLRMAGDLLASAGYEVRMLGADLPLTSIEPIARRHAPDIFGFSATMPAAGTLLPLAIDEVLRVRPAAAVLAGGSGVPRDLRSGPTLAICQRLSETVETVDALLQRADLN